MSKIGPFGNQFRKFFSNCFARVSTVIDHPCESYLPASPPVSRSILPAALLCKNRGKVETLFENFLIRSVQHRLQRVLSSYGKRSFHLPSISTWRKSAILETPEQKFFVGVKLMLKLPYTLTCKNPSNLTPAKSNFAADVTMRDCIRKSSHHPERRLAGTKIALRHSDAELIGETVGVFFPRG